MHNILTILATASLLLSACCSGDNKAKAVYLDFEAPIEERVEDALSRMTLEEKVAIVHAQSKFSSAGVPRLGIPTLWTSDGPHGVRAEVLWDKWSQAKWTNDSCVAFPALTCLAASWDRELAALYGRSIGEEAKYRNKHVLLGPGVNIYRTPLNGRNFEYMGEDPYLASQMVVPYVKGVQSNNVAACVKHYALNNEEECRHTTDVDLSDRALYEIYLPAFKAAVQEGGAWSIMGAYNLYRGQHLCHNKRMLKDILKGEWGFDGAVVSDWGGAHDSDEAIANGLDLEFGTWTDGLFTGPSNVYAQYHLANPYLERLRDGRASEEELNDKCRRVLRLMMRTSMSGNNSLGEMCSEAHYAAARKIGAEGIVLLKNDNGLLPVQSGVRKIAVMGENAIKMMTVGGGSSSLKAQHEVSPLKGISDRAAAAGIEVKYARAYVGSTDGSQDGITAGVKINEDRDAQTLAAEALELARESDLVIFVGGLNKNERQDCEGCDREFLDLPYNQSELVAALAAVNPNIVVCLVSGNAVTMPWLDAVPSVVQAWYCGSEAGNSLADVLFGDVCPSGKLPFTFPAALADSPAHQEGMQFPNPDKVYYKEGIYVGYRWFEHKDIKPLFAFGHGLSYTSFQYGDAKLSSSTMKRGGSITVSIPVTNTGKCAGAEVVQLYVTDDECSVDRPEKELKGFEKVFLQPGESTVVKIALDESALQYFDEQAHRWVAEKGRFTVQVGSASDDIRSTASFELR